MVDVTSGDSFTIAVDQERQIEISLEGIDVPNYAKLIEGDSRAFRSRLALGKVVRVQWKGAEEQDRISGHIYFGDLWLNHSLVENSFARAKFADADFLSAQHKAKKNHRGIWAKYSSAGRRKESSTKKKIGRRLFLGIKWYQGGTLHNLGALDWQRATPDNKLATCADFVTVAWNSGEFRARIHFSLKSIEDIKPYAIDMVEFIDGTTKELPDPKKNRQIYTNLKVKEIVAAGMIMMKWIK